MPPKGRQISRNSIEKEKRIVLAISTLKNKEIRNIREAARLYNVPHSTLQDRLREIINRLETRVNSYKITQNKEESLV